jgi:hypothetical protein
MAHWPLPTSCLWPRAGGPSCVVDGCITVKDNYWSPLVEPLAWWIAPLVAALLINIWALVRARPPPAVIACIKGHPNHPARLVQRPGVQVQPAVAGMVAAELNPVERAAIVSIRPAAAVDAAAVGKATIAADGPVILKAAAVDREWAEIWPR